MADATVSRTEFAGDRARSVTASTRKSGTATRRRHARSASARTWCSCQVARDACTVAMTCRAMTSASIVGVGAGAWPMTRRTSSSTCSAPPRISPASARQVRRCSTSERGACFASRVDSVACWASCCRSTTVGKRECSSWNRRARTASSASMSPRREDQRRSNPWSIPTISRISRLPSAAPPRSANRTPIRSVSSASSRVL